MIFRFYTRQISQATRGLAATVFIIGMLLIGAAMLIFALPEFFAYLAAGVFFFMGLVVCGYAFKLFYAAMVMDRNAPPVDQQEFRDDQPEIYTKKVDVTVKDTQSDQ